MRKVKWRQSVLNLHVYVSLVKQISSTESLAHRTQTNLVDRIYKRGKSTSDKEPGRFIRKTTPKSVTRLTCVSILRDWKVN